MRGLAAQALPGEGRCYGVGSAPSKGPFQAAAVVLWDLRELMVEREPLPLGETSRPGRSLMTPGPTLYLATGEKNVAKCF